MKEPRIDTEEREIWHRFIIQNAYVQGDGKGKFTAIPYHENGLLINKDVKDLALITVKDKKMILVANNDDFMQVISIHEKDN